MAQRWEVIPEMYLEYSKRYKEYSEFLEKMVSEMKNDTEKIFPPFTGCSNDKSEFSEMVYELSVHQSKILYWSQWLQNVSESFMIEMSAPECPYFN